MNWRLRLRVQRYFFILELKKTQQFTWRSLARFKSSMIIKLTIHSTHVLYVTTLDSIEIMVIFKKSIHLKRDYAPNIHVCHISILFKNVFIHTHTRNQILLLLVSINYHFRIFKNKYTTILQLLAILGTWLTRTHFVTCKVE